MCLSCCIFLCCLLFLSCMLCWGIVVRLLCIVGCSLMLFCMMWKLLKFLMCCVWWWIVFVVLRVNWVFCCRIVWMWWWMVILLMWCDRMFVWWRVLLGWILCLFWKVVCFCRWFLVWLFLCCWKVWWILLIGWKSSKNVLLNLISRLSRCRVSWIMRVLWFVFLLRWLRRRSVGWLILGCRRSGWKECWFSWGEMLREVCCLWGWWVFYNF